MYAKTYWTKKISSKFYDAKAEVMLIMIRFHDPGYRSFIQTVNDGLKNIAQLEYSRHR
nr:hypothetical protein [Prevotella histicola]